MLVRRMNPVAMVIGSLSFFLSGVLYPVTVLPDWLRASAGCCRSRTRSRCCAARCSSAPAPAALADSFVALMIFAGVLAPLGAAVFAFALRRARIDGSLSHY